MFGLARQALRAVVEQPETVAGKRFALMVQALILVSLASFSLETLPDLRPEQHADLALIETITVCIFTLEYVLRLAVAERPARFVFSVFGLVDLLAIAPFWLATGLDLRGVRSLRLMRLFKILKLARYSRSIDRFKRALLLVREDLTLFFAASLIVLWLSAVGIYNFEHEAQPEAFATVFDGLLWALASLTTVGFGDVYPVTTGGRTFTFFVLMVGLGVVAVPTGLIASALTQVRSEEQPKRPSACARLAEQDRQALPGNRALAPAERGDAR